MNYEKKIWQKINDDGEKILRELNEAMKHDSELRNLEFPKRLHERIRSMIPDGERAE